MKISDKVYGKFEIKDKILIDLINSHSIQRLKGINQYGITKKAYGFKDYSRYDHSVGVMMLLKVLEASLEEQIAGLLHDMSHTAFSHLVDRAIGDPSTENLQDDEFENYFMSSDALKILKKYNFNPADFTDLHNFPLLEQPSPKLCADRIDYILRELESRGDTKSIEKILPKLTTYNNKIVFKTKTAASLFGRKYMWIQKIHWTDTEILAHDHVFSEILKDALTTGIITKSDLFTTDREVLLKLKNSKKYDLSVLKGKSLMLYASPSGEIHLIKKFRSIDPEYISHGKIEKLSNTDTQYSQLLLSEKKRIKKGVKISLQKK